MSFPFSVGGDLAASLGSEADSAASSGFTGGGVTIGGLNSAQGITPTTLLVAGLVGLVLFSVLKKGRKR